MSADTEIRRLVQRWEALAKQGHPPAPEQLCRGCPELLPELLRHIRERHGRTLAAEPLAPTIATLSHPRPAPAESKPRPTVPGYEVLSELGRGAMGVVYKARQTGLNRLVALKMIRDGVLAGPQQLEDFQREAEAVAQLRHPGIVHVYEFGIHNSLPYFSMELVEGGNLAERFLGRPLPANAAARLVATLARAVQHAHQQRIVHRDLKPANVLLTTDGHPKVTDFGLAKRLDHGSTTQGGLKGTPGYMAPEQTGDAGRKVGPPADVYALGAILYELLAGRPPFVGNGLAEILDQLRFHHPRPPSAWRADLPADLDTVCLKCLEKDPAQRYESAEALAQDLDAFLAGAPIKGRTSGDQAGERLDKILHRSRSSFLKPWVAKVGLEVLATVERGDGTIVYRGKHLDTDAPARIKVLLPDADARKRADLLHEASALARLDHPGLPRFLSAGMQDGHHYLATEWVEGESLRVHALKTKPGAPEVARLVGELCRILHYAHGQGVVHQDLRPENVLLTEAGMRLLNVGLARPPDETEDPSQSQLLDLFRYKSPEQMDAEPAPPSVAVNVYTLGTILYELLTEKPVFRMRSLFGAMDQLRNQKPVPPSQLQPLLPAGLDAVCLRCLEKEPRKRYPTAEALAEALRRFAG